MRRGTAETGGEEVAERFALIIGVENYVDPKIPPVRYAENDAKDFGAALQLHGYNPSNITMLLSAAATKTIIESRSRTLLLNAVKEDQIVIFYAGHGFSENDRNYLTCSDTVRGDLVRTSIRLQDLFSLFHQSHCKRIMFFLDSCHSGFDVDESMRGIISDMTDEEFKVFVKDSEYHVAFASCATDQYSYSSPALKHGIWSYHIIEALNGNVTSALEKNRFLTADSLQAYLKQEIPRTIRKELAVGKVQTPRLLGNYSGIFLIADFEHIFEERAAKSIPDKAQLRKVLFSGVKAGSVKSLSGFKKGSHSVPKAYGKSTKDFVRGIGQQDLEDYVNGIFSGMKKAFKYKLRDIDSSIGNGDARLIGNDFTVYVTLELNPEDVSEYLLKTEVTEIQTPEVIVSQAFNDLFSNTFDSLTFQSTSKFKIKGLIEEVEDLQNGDISIDYPADLSSCTIKIKGLNASIVVEDSEFRIEYSRNIEVRNMIAEFRAVQVALLGHGVKLLALTS